MMIDNIMIDDNFMEPIHVSIEDTLTRISEYLMSTYKIDMSKHEQLKKDIESLLEPDDNGNVDYNFIMDYIHEEYPITNPEKNRVNPFIYKKSMGPYNAARLRHLLMQPDTYNEELQDAFDELGLEYHDLSHTEDM